MEDSKEQVHSWPDVYQPQSLEEMALNPRLRQRLEGLQREGWPGHLLIYGPPATGKTSLVRLITRDLARSEDGHSNVLAVSASQTRSIDYIRDTVLPLMKSRGGILRFVDPGFRGVVVFSEADGLTADAQNALKDALDVHGRTHIAIFTTNEVAKVNDALASRCDKLEFQPPPVEERARVLERVLAAEQLSVEPETIRRFAEHESDMRQLLRNAQNSITIHGTLQIDTTVGGDPRSDAWPTPVDGSELLASVAWELSNYVALPEGASPAIALWVLFAHGHELFGHSPLLVAASPVKRSGKTTLLELLRRVVPYPRFVSNISPASLFRLTGVVDDNASQDTLRRTGPVWTLLADEADSWLRDGSDFRGLLNAGHARSSAYVLRVVDGRSKTFAVWFPKVLALIADRGGLPQTVLDRSIVVPMRRRLPHEEVKRLRTDVDLRSLTDLRRQAERWIADNSELLRTSDPAMPDRLHDRAADNWRPLFAIADIAGGPWPVLARRASLILTPEVDETGEDAVMLLGDIRDLFQREQINKIPTLVIIDALRLIEDRPWSQRLDPFSLAKTLRRFDIKPKALWHTPDIGPKGMKRGYYLADFAAAFERYLPPL